MDKIVLSRMVTLEQFGYYTVASSAALGLLLLISPLVQAVLPRAVQLRGQPLALRHLSFKLMGLIAGMVIGCAAVFICCGRWLLMLWLHDATAVEVIHPLLSVLLLGTAMNAFYNIGYIHWLVQERVGRILSVNGLIRCARAGFDSTAGALEGQPRGNAGLGSDQPDWPHAQSGMAQAQIV